MPILLSILLAAAPLAEPAPPAEPAQPASTEQAVDWDKEFGVARKERDPVTGEIPLEPYPQSDANAGAAPYKGDAMARAFGGKDGIRRVTDRTVELSEADPRIKAIFAGHDLVRLRRTLFEQVCFILGGGCSYSGRDMKTTHKGLGTTRADLNALVENLQRAMREGHVPFAAQNRLLAKLAPMDRAITER
jgi:hemoglobin